MNMQRKQVSLPEGLRTKASYNPETTLRRNTRSAAWLIGAMVTIVLLFRTLPWLLASNVSTAPLGNLDDEVIRACSDFAIDQDGLCRRPKVDADAQDIHLPQLHIAMTPIDPEATAIAARSNLGRVADLGTIFKARQAMAATLTEQQLLYYLEAVPGVSISAPIAERFSGRVLGERDDRYDIDHDGDLMERFWTDEQIGFVLKGFVSLGLQAEAEGDLSKAQDYYALALKIHTVNSDMQLNAAQDVLVLEEPVNDLTHRIPPLNLVTDVYQYTPWTGPADTSKQPYSIPGDTYLKQLNLHGWRMINAPLDPAHPEKGSKPTLIHSWGMAKPVDSELSDPSALDSVQPAFDGELDWAYATATLAARTQNDALFNQAVRMIKDIAQTGIIKVGNDWVLVGNPEWFRQALEINLSYFRPAYTELFVKLDPENAEKWRGLAASYYKLLAMTGPVPGDWNTLRFEPAWDAKGHPTGKLVWTFGPDHFHQPQDSMAAIREAQRIWSAVAEDYYSGPQGQARVKAFLDQLDCSSTVRTQDKDYANDANPKCVVADWAHHRYPTSDTSAPTDGNLPPKLSHLGDSMATYYDKKREAWLSGPSLPASLNWLLIPEISGDAETMSLLAQHIHGAEQMAWLNPHYRPLSDPKSEWPNEYYPRTIAWIASQSGADGSIAYTHQFWQQALPQLPTVEHSPTGVERVQYQTPSLEDRVRAGRFPAFVAETVDYQWRNAAKVVEDHQLIVSLHVVPGAELLLKDQMQLPFGLRKLGQTEYLPDTATGFWLVGRSQEAATGTDRILPIAQYQTLAEAEAAGTVLQPMLHDYTQLFVRTSAQGFSGWYIDHGVVRRNPENMPVGHSDMGGADVPTGANSVAPEDLIIYTAPKKDPQLPALMYGSLLTSPRLTQFATGADLLDLRKDLTTALNATPYDQYRSPTVGKDGLAQHDTRELWRTLQAYAAAHPASPLVKVLADSEFEYVFRESVMNYDDARSYMAMRFVMNVFALGIPNNEQISDSLSRQLWMGKQLERIPGRYHNDVAQQVNFAWTATVVGDYDSAEGFMKDAIGRMHGWTDAMIREHHDQYYETYARQADMYKLKATDMRFVRNNQGQSEAVKKALGIYKTLLNPSVGAVVGPGFLPDYYSGGVDAGSLVGLLKEAHLVDEHLVLTPVAVRLIQSDGTLVLPMDDDNLGRVTQLLRDAQSQGFIDQTFYTSRDGNSIEYNELIELLRAANYIDGQNRLTPTAISVLKNPTSQLRLPMNKSEIEKIKELLADAHKLGGLPDQDHRQRAAIKLQLAELEAQDAMLRQDTSSIDVFVGDFAVAGELNNHERNFGGGDPYVRIKAQLGPDKLLLQKFYMEFGALTGVYSQDQQRTIDDPQPFLDQLQAVIDDLNHNAGPTLRLTENTFRQTGPIDSLLAKDRPEITDLDIDDAVGTVRDSKRQEDIQSLSLYYMQFYALRAELHLNRYRLIDNYGHELAPTPGSPLPEELAAALSDFAAARHYSHLVIKGGFNFFNDYDTFAAWAETSMQMEQAEVAAEHFFHKTTDRFRLTFDHQQRPYIVTASVQDEFWEGYFGLHNPSIEDMQLLDTMSNLMPPVLKSQHELIKAQIYLDHAQMIFREEPANPWVNIAAANEHWAASKRAYEPVDEAGLVQTLIVPLYIQKQQRDLYLAISSFDYSIFVGSSFTVESRRAATKELR